MTAAADAADLGGATGPAHALPAALLVPPDLRPLLAKHAALDWGAVAWDAVRARVEALERLERLAAGSRLTTPEAGALGESLRGGDARPPRA